MMQEGFEMKRLLSVLLAVVMILTALSVFPDTVNATNYGSTGFDPAELTRGDTFTMGMYPQGRVTSSSTITALNEIECTMTNYGYMKNCDAQSHTYEAADISYADIEYNGARYRKVLFNEIRPAYPYSQTISSAGNHEVNDLPANTVYYFRWEPIVWKVLANESNGVYVTSQNLLDSQPFHNYSEATTWETCSLRTWLNEEFYNSAFSSAEQEKMISAENIASSVPDSDITDHVWLLSYNDTHNADYGFSTVTEGDYANDKARKAQVTEYAKYQGVEYDSYSACASWWVLYPSTSTNQIVCTYSGRYDSENFAKTAVGIRPAFILSKVMTHQITFNPNGGSGSIDPAVIPDGEELTVPECTFTPPDGKVFWGWNTLPEGTTDNYGTWYDPGDKITLTEDLTLYARWSEPILSICSYDMTEQKSMLGGKYTNINGGGDSAYGFNNYTLQLGDECSVTAVPGDGYEFVGWYKSDYINKDAQGNPIQDARPYLNDDNLITANLTYTFGVNGNIVLCPVFKKSEPTPEPTPATKPVPAPEASTPATNGSAAVSEVVDAKLPRPSIKKPAGAKKSATVKWKKLSKKDVKKVQGIEVQAATDKKFTQNVVTKGVKKTKASLKIKKLKSKKTYYVHVRTYKKIGGVKHVSKWSKAKKVKIK